MPLMIRRDAACSLLDIDENVFKAMRHRDQLPLRTPHELPDEVSDARGYTPFQVFATIVQLDLKGRYDISLDKAALIASHALRAVPRWRDIVSTSADVVAGRAPAADILLAAVDLPNVKPTAKQPFTVAVGTIAEIAAKHPKMSAMIATSLTRCAALMRQRADEHGIDLGDFFEVSR